MKHKRFLPSILATRIIQVRI